MATIRVRNHYTVASDQTLQFADEAAFLLASGGKENAPELTNFGKVYVTSALERSNLIAIDSDPAAASIQVLNKAGALISVAASGDNADATGIAIHQASALVNNKGGIQVSAADGAARGVWSDHSGLVQLHNDGTIVADGSSASFAVFLSGDADIVNTGHISAEHASFAQGVVVRGDASFLNTGDIVVDAGATGEGVNVDGVLTRFENQGRIIVNAHHPQSSDDGGAFGVAFGVSAEVRETTILNSGTIKAIGDGEPDVAIQQSDYPNTAQTAVVIENTGKIIGSIELYTKADDQVRNFGLIDGRVNLGKGDDHLTNAGHGQVTGLVIGLSGDDVLIGGRSADQLCGDSPFDDLKYGGSDSLDGGAGNDTLVCGTGQDTITGGKGADVLTGGADADVFVYAKVSESAGADQDLITDLDNTDTIDLSAIDADKTAAGDQAFVLVDHLGGHAGEAALAYDASAEVTLLQLDVNGDGVADSEIRITGDHSDFTNFAL